MTTKILALTDALGNLVRFILLPGQRFDRSGAASHRRPVLRRADRRQSLRQQRHHRRPECAGAKIVISQHPRRARSHPLDKEMYKWRHLIENFFCKLKEFKRIAMRADKTDTSFAAIINLAAAVINSR